MKPNLNFDNYKRIFAFGCSFTQYGWPTWADLIAYQNPNAKYYNYGRAGMGNLGIACRIIEADKRYNFSETDLVMVLWSTFCREDRYLDNAWLSYGNIYNSPYPKEFLKNFTDPTGYLIRDHAIINLTISYLNNSKFNSLLLKSSPFDFTETDEKNVNIVPVIASLYAAQYNSMPMDLYTFMNCDWNLCKQTFYDDLCAEPHMRNDSHPFTSVYADYLNTIGIEMTPSTMAFAKNADELLHSSKTRTELNKNFKILADMQSKDKQQLF